MVCLVVPLAPIHNVEACVFVLRPACDQEVSTLFPGAMGAEFEVKYFEERREFMNDVARRAFLFFLVVAPAHPGVAPQAEEDTCMHACMHACMYAWTHLCMYACMHA